MISDSPWDTLLSWRGFLVGKNGKRFGKVGPLCLFWTVWKVKNGIAFRDEVLSI